MLESIVIVTIAVQNLAAVEPAWNEHFDYETASRGVISAELAATWDADAISGQPYVLMQPADGDPVFVRFIEDEPVDGYGPMRTHGWNAIELLVEDPDALAEELADTVFETIGEPKDLWDAPNAPRAMQVLGPADEVVYLTRNGNFATNLPIDRVFIMVLAGPSMQSLSEYWSSTLGVPVGEPMPFQISVISNAQGLPADTVYPLAVATVSEEFLIELDEYPEQAGPRPVRPGSIPPGVASVTFTAQSLDAFELEWRAQPRAIQERPYDGRRAAVTVGPAGEWIEIIEISAPAP